MAQENYVTLTEKADDIVSNAKEDSDYNKALRLYEQAFKQYPDSINAFGLYEISKLYSRLKEKDKAFTYLQILSNSSKGEYGFPAWRPILDKDIYEDFKNLLQDPRWETLTNTVLKKQKHFYEALLKSEKEFYKVKKSSLKNSKTNVELYKAIKQNAPYIEKKQKNYSISLPINDTLQTSFFIHLPKNYTPTKKYSLLFFLHGAVRHSRLLDYQTAEINLEAWNRFYTKYADLNEVIMVFPRGSKEYNWMTPDEGFFMVPKIVRMIKKCINIDDNKVFICGHSNGATGSFSYLMKQSTDFAGFYGFNTEPMVNTGGTFVENILNRSFINFSTDLDYYYPPNANDDFTAMMKNIKADYKEYRYNGFPHWFPQFNESEPAYQILFEDIKKRERNPFPKEITWEFDDNNYGSTDWINNSKLDTLIPKAKWHKELNFKITKWLEYDDKDELKTIDVDKNAFDFPRQSGMIKAVYNNNVFTVETSRIKSFVINISPEMVNLKEKVKVYINGKLYFNEYVYYNRDFMLKNFQKNKDREQVWINEIKINL
jgi:predicted esterase